MAIDDGLRPMIRRNIIAHWATIETGTTEAGVPDLNGCLPPAKSSGYLSDRLKDQPGVEFWIECKACKANAVKFQPLQVGWLMTRVRYGGRAFVAVRRHGARMDGAFDELWLFDGAYAGVLSQYGVNGVKCMGTWYGGEAKWDWNAVTTLLRTHTMDHEAAKDIPEPRKGL